jgi:hypothetical protein
MKLDDFTFDFKGYHGCDSRCRVRIYRIDKHANANALQRLHAGDAVIVLSQLPENAGTSVTNASELIASDLYEQMRLAGHPLEPLRTVWIEHYPTLEGGHLVRDDMETFDRVTYGAFVPHGPRPMFRSAQWNHLSPRLVVELLGEDVR